MCAQIKVLLHNNNRSVCLHEAATHSDLTPYAVQARQALVTLDASVTAVALGGRVTLYPYMLHSLQGRRERETY